DVPRLGVTASLAIENMVREACDRRLMIFIVGAQGAVKERLATLHVFDGVPPENLTSSRLDALRRASLSLQSMASVGANAVKEEAINLSPMAASKLNADPVAVNQDRKKGTSTSPDAEDSSVVVHPSDRSAKP
ncbi:MAG: hypothetical protein ABG776_14945, partial [Cyanobacteria bacterium J06555_13]